MISDHRLAQLAREVERTRAEYQEATGTERARLWRLHQRAIENYNRTLARANQFVAIREA